MSAPIEPRWHKRDTLIKLYQARDLLAHREKAVEEAQGHRVVAQKEVNVLEQEAMEWLRRDNMHTEVLLLGVPTGRRRGLAVVFKRTEYCLHQTVVEPIE